MCFLIYGQKTTNPQRLFLATFDGEIKGTFPIPGEHNLLKISKDGKLVMLAEPLITPISNLASSVDIYPKFYLRLFDIETQKEAYKPFSLGRIKHRMLFGCPAIDSSIALSNNKKLVAIYRNSCITIYNPDTWKPCISFLSWNFLPRTLQFINQDRYLWVEGNNKVAIFDIQTGKELFQFIFDFNKEQHWVIVAADGRYDGSKATLDYIKIKPEGLPDKPENYFSPREKPHLYVDGLLATFFNAPIPDHYWFKNPQQIQQISSNQQKNSYQSFPTNPTNSQPLLLPFPQQPLPPQTPFVSPLPSSE
jgi:hypothetical protein